MSKPPVTTPDYTSWLGELKSRIQSARISAARSVNRELILLYWDIGQAILEKQEKLAWGKSVVEQLSCDLQKEFSGLKGLSPANLWRVQQFYRAYSAPEFLAQIAREMTTLYPPGHHIVLLPQMKNHKKYNFLKNSFFLCATP